MFGIGNKELFNKGKFSFGEEEIMGYDENGKYYSASINNEKGLIHIYFPLFKNQELKLNNERDILGEDYILFGEWLINNTEYSIIEYNPLEFSGISEEKQKMIGNYMNNKLNNTFTELEKSIERKIIFTLRDFIHLSFLYILAKNNHKSIHFYYLLELIMFLAKNNDICLSYRKSKNLLYSDINKIVFDLIKEGNIEKEGGYFFGITEKGLNEINPELKKYI